MTPARLAVGLVAIAALAYGCGSDEISDSTATEGRHPVAADGPSDEVAGPKDPAENLERLLRRSAPELKRVSVECPPRHGIFPFSCRLTASVDAKIVEGNVTVIGVYRPTRTYAYELSYEPASG